MKQKKGGTPSERTWLKKGPLHRQPIVSARNGDLRYTGTITKGKGKKKG